MMFRKDDVQIIISRINASLQELGRQKELSGKNKKKLSDILEDLDELFSLMNIPPNREASDGLPFSVQTPLHISKEEKPVILIVDNNNDIQEYLHDSLSEKYSVIHITHAKEALERVKGINPDIIISDILLPDIRGDSMCSKLKSSMETSHIPVIFLTALNEKENIIMGLESGADDYIVKPFDIMVLKARIRNILQNREKFRHTILASDAVLDDVSYTNSLDKEFLDKAVKVIENELSNPAFSINEFCRAIGMSRTSVYNKIKTLTDQGPNDFIRIIRLKKAKELLTLRKHTVAEVSVIVGFSDSKYFSTSFKKQFGVSPSKIK
ncbi:MAG: DNA-binding response regulator [Tannerellaceae bacterium]|jgi:DNA-binding response OmpR family regulator|nr:DNA-binding response regulator [Tannerellaceae bacterium]